jgi:hypothetical protein
MGVLMKMREIPLTRGYVALVSDEDYDRVMAAGPWRAITDPKTEVDHWNRDGLRNTRRNLRLATRSQNNANRRKQAGCSSGYRGVSWSKHASKWKAQISIDGKVCFLGYFASEVRAALAYDTAARERFGEFANCNFPPKKPCATIGSPSAASEMEK